MDQKGGFLIKYFVHGIDSEFCTRFAFRRCRPDEYGDPALAHSVPPGHYTQVVTGIDQVE